jgi:hypothetical protein
MGHDDNAIIDGFWRAGFCGRLDRETAFGPRTAQPDLQTKTNHQLTAGFNY